MKINFLIIISVLSFYGFKVNAQWVHQNSGSTSSILECVYFVNSTTGYISSTYQLHNILKTTNSGQNWNIVFSESDSYFLPSVFFVDSNTGWTIGDNIVYKTTNGGNNWNSYTAIFNGIQLQSIYFLNSTTGWACGDGGSIVKSTNGGLTWNIQLNTGIEFFSSIQFLNSLTGYAAGYITSQSKGVIFKTTNGGTNWTNIPLPNHTHFLFTFNMVNSLTGYSFGEYSTFGGIKTTNGGSSWNILSTPIDEFHSTCFITTEVGWLTGYFGKIYKTTNGGNNWIVVDSSASSFLNSITVKSPQIWAVGSNGEIIYSSNSGTSINQISNEVVSNYRLYQNYPNPFNPSTKIKFQLKSKGLVLLKLYNILGREIKTLLNKNLESGIYEIDFNAEGLASGVYIYKILTNSFIASKKMILQK